MRHTTDKRIVAGPKGLTIPDDLLTLANRDEVRRALGWVNAEKRKARETTDG